MSPRVLLILTSVAFFPSLLVAAAPLPPVVNDPELRIELVATVQVLVDVVAVIAGDDMPVRVTKFDEATRLHEHQG